jgi:hypothetical protein
MGYPRDIPRNILPPDYTIFYIASGIKGRKRGKEENDGKV